MPRFVLDQSRFSQIIMNLISNSVKFTKSGGIKVIVTYMEGEKMTNKEISDDSDFDDDFTFLLQ